MWILFVRCKVDQVPTHSDKLLKVFEIYIQKFKSCQKSISAFSGTSDTIKQISSLISCDPPPASQRGTGIWDGTCAIKVEDIRSTVEDLKVSFLVESLMRFTFISTVHWCNDR